MNNSQTEVVVGGGASRDAEGVDGAAVQVEVLVGSGGVSREIAISQVVEDGLEVKIQISISALAQCCLHSQLVLIAGPSLVDGVVQPGLHKGNASRRITETTSVNSN